MLKEMFMKELFLKIFKKIKDELFTIPNMLSIVRLLLIPLIVYLYVFKKDNLIAAAVVVISTLTDIVDGFIARRFNMITDFGKFIDPVADKATQLTVFICLMTEFKLMILPFVVLLVKELSAFLLRLVVYKETEIVDSAKWHGKASTGIVVFTLMLHLIWHEIPSSVSVAMIVFCTLFMTFSGTLYTIDGLKILKNGRKKV